MMLKNQELQSLRNMGNEAEAAADEIVRLRAQLDEAIKDADRAIEHARRVDAKEREALRAALAWLVRVYVIDGAATTPSGEIGDAWKAAQRALLRPNDQRGAPGL